MYTILVIDDNEDYRTSFREVLELENYKTLEAENGLIGLAMIQQYVPDMILCDVEMPVMNGIDVLRTVKADVLLAKIPFVIITGQSDRELVQTAHDLGVAAYLTKPLAINDFLAVIIRFLQINTVS
jgi:two-component system alkaline phosphatase synthesis response regulator PhoP